MPDPLLVIVEAPGKAPAIRAALARIGYRAAVVPTRGHLAGFPASLFPCGLSLTGSTLVEELRGPLPHAREFRQRLSRALGTLRAAAVILATDNDAEGDAIALDAAGIVLELAPATEFHRALPGAMTPAAWQGALDDALAAGPVPISGTSNSLASRAVEGRFRAALDRWLGAMLTRRTGMPCGRVRLSLLGLAGLWHTAPHLCRGLPETGEVVLSARDPGRPGRVGLARLALHGPPATAARRLAERYAGRPVPGLVTPVESAGAMIAPRFGCCPPYNTADLLVHAGRMLNVPVSRIMHAMQSAYMAGRISYPRTDGRSLHESLVPPIARLAREEGLGDGEGLARTLSAANAIDSRVHPARESHSPLLPVIRGPQGVASLRQLMHRQPEAATEPGLEDAVTALVARRAVEACRDDAVLPGRWSGGEDRLDRDEMELLASLDWTIETGPAPPWARLATTGLRAWPADTVLVEGMHIEDIGRPSTFARHADRAVAEHAIELPDPFELPRPAPPARAALARVEDGLRHPETARLLLRAIETPVESSGAALEQAMLARLEHLFEIAPAAVLEPLADLLEEERQPGSWYARARAPDMAGETAAPDEVEESRCPQAPGARREPEPGPSDLDLLEAALAIPQPSPESPQAEPGSSGGALEALLDPVETFRGEDVRGQYHPGELEEGSERAYPDHAVDGIDDGGIADGLVPGEEEEEPQPG